MSEHFCISVRFLQPTYHGRGDRGEPEWPPAPLRVFQALVAASAARWAERIRLEHAVPALSWLGRQPPPAIVAAVGRPASSAYRLYVPDNVGDELARSWSRGGTKELSGYRVEKDVRPIRLADHFEAVHYLWPAAGADFDAYKGILIEAARSITHLGWGIDMVAAQASTLSDAEANHLAGERWSASEDGSGTALRVPTSGTLDALIAKHAAFLERIGVEGFRPVPPLTAFRVVGYRRATDPPRRPFVAFSLLKPEATHANDFRPFDAARRGIAVAGMLRHACREGAEALGCPPERVASFVLGHGERVGQPYAPVEGPRLAFLPLPSIEARGRGAGVVTGIRRAILTVLNGDDGGDLRRLARLLSGSDLVAEGRIGAEARLSQIHYRDATVDRYTGPATTWTTVTPIILPGYDDPRKIRRRWLGMPEGDGPRADPAEKREGLAKLERRIDRLLRKAILQAGYSDELARHAELGWRSIGFLPGVEPATRYEPPRKLRRFRRLHVRITWRAADGRPIPISGPICLGGGRYYGLGLLASG